MIFAGTLACFLKSAGDAFQILLLSGAGSGAIYLLRWFWWRINAWTEIIAMPVATFVAIALVIIKNNTDIDLSYGAIDHNTMNLMIAVVATTITWIVTTFVTKPESEETLRKFYRQCQPGGPGWKKVIDEAVAEGDMIDGEEHGKAWEVPLEILCVFIGCIFVYCSLFSIGSFIYENIAMGSTLGAIAAAAAIFLFKIWGKLHTHEQN